MKRFFTLMLILLMAATTASPAMAAKKKARPAPDRYAAIVIDAQTGYVLTAQNADKQRYPASLTKMMTLYMVFDAIQQGHLRKNQRIDVSRHAESQVPSKLGLKAGQTIRVEDAILSLVTKSANDSAVVLAEAVGGTEARFAQLMTARARQLGMTSTRFTNASGLHNPAQISTARDMAVLAQALMRDFPQEYRYFRVTSFSYAGVTHTSHNRLMNTYLGMDGLKTGYVYASGFNLASSAVRDGRRLIGVVFGGRTAVTRNQAMANLLDAGFEKLRQPQVAAAISRRPAAGVPSSASKGLQIAGRVPLPERKPVHLRESATSLAAAAGHYTRRHTPAQDRLTPANSNAGTGAGFNALALVDNLNDNLPHEQGDAEELYAADAAAPRPLVRSFDHTGAPANTHSGANIIRGADVNPALAAAEGKGTWAVQVGAFSTHDASISALQNVKQQLPRHIAGGSQYLIVPLMTNRGMIYRARLAGLDRNQATQACRILQGNCLIMAAQ